ncbi:MFS general substrate transporter [Eremomyces bilateralis CBS 781.70]|uniref:MFS general substrate transporter n=1 Tax=Eremomyces bilateralis CBS 781.70 TaxID=1392243 RepID=A0A6G1FRZ5_9PEZI|nr:MFS general substrate transporter [Eremomyces bilateralis CBS 781.70]KAF1808506.1 MFS general substrate transporter [Eremomyces bilateralis CBS 781.70]
MDSGDPKTGVVHDDAEKHLDFTPGEVPEFDTGTEKRLMRRIDWRLLPILGALYSISLIDRTNISNARVAGMAKDLGLTVGDRYAIALTMFFIPYFFFELPSNIVLRKVGSANWLSFIAFAWGTVMLGQGFVNSWQALTACRTLLGFFEAGFFPGCVYLATCWYIRFEVQKRLAAFYLLSVFVGGLASILAFGLMQMEGLSGIRGWRWIFIIEGLLTQVVAILAWFLIIDFPDKAERKGFLSPAEATFIANRIESDRGDSVPDELTWGRFFHHLGDWKLWTFSLMFASVTMPAYAFAYFSPVIIAGMGYSGGEANALAAPPACAAVFTAFGFAWLGDKYRVRAPVIAAQAIITIIGLMIVAYHTNHGVRYFGIFLGVMGCQGNIPAILAYQSNNIRLQSKRSVGSALQIGFGAIGGILASTTFMEKEAPYYRTGLWITAGLQFFILGALVACSAYFHLKNKQLDLGTLAKPIEGQVGFKYTL